MWYASFSLLQLKTQMNRVATYHPYHIQDIHFIYTIMYAFSSIWNVPCTRKLRPLVACSTSDRPPLISPLCPSKSHLHPLLEVLDSKLVLVVLHDGRVNMLGKHIHLSRGKLARGHLLLKQQVELGEGAARGLGDAEVCVDEAEEARAGLSWHQRRQLEDQHMRGEVWRGIGGNKEDKITYPEETSIVAPVPGSRVEHIWRQDAAHDAHNVAMCTNLISPVDYFARVSHLRNTRDRKRLTIECVRGQQS